MIDLNDVGTFVSTMIPGGVKVRFGVYLPDIKVAVDLLLST